MDEWVLLRDSVSEWTKATAGARLLRASRDSDNPLGFQPAILAEMAELGWTGVVVPEAYGGSELGFRGAGIILEELGRNLVPAPLIGSAIASASAIAWGGAEALKIEWLPKIADGSAVAALAIDEGPRHQPDRLETRAYPVGDGFRLSGTKSFVLEGMAADLLIVAAQTGGGVALFAVPASAPGITRDRRRLADARGYAEIRFDDVEIGAAGMLDGGLLLMTKALDVARAAVTAESFGLVQQAFETTLDYLRIRVQYGRPIGSFQALQHRAVEMFGRIQLVRGLVEASLDALDADPATASGIVSAVKAAVCDLTNLVTREMVQMHGGIAITDEHDAGLYLKRARVLEATFGSAAFHRDRFAQLRGF